MVEELVINANKKAIWLVNALMLNLVVAAADLEEIAVVDLVVVAAVQEHVTSVKKKAIWLVNALMLNLVVAAADIIVEVVVVDIPKVVVAAADVAVITVEMLITSLVIAINHETWIMSSVTIAKALVICLVIVLKLLHNFVELMILVR